MGDNSIPDRSEYEQISHLKILSTQLEELKNNGALFVLNTCIFNGIDYNPERFFTTISQWKMQ